MVFYLLFAAVYFTISESLPRDSEKARYLRSLSPGTIPSNANLDKPKNDDGLTGSKYFKEGINLEAEADSKFEKREKHRMKKRRKRNVRTDNAHLWPSPEIEYEVNRTAYNSRELATIAAAFKHIENRTCVRFSPRQNKNGSTPFIYVTKDKDNPKFCHSYIGLDTDHVKQPVRLGPGCIYMGTVVHELMHRLGFYHEQSRMDRDRFVKILDQNVKPNSILNFKKHASNYLDQPYDYHSLMHYNRRTFSKDGKPTIIPNDTRVLIGQRIGLSEGDVKRINRLFKCDNETGTEYRMGLEEALRELKNRYLPDLAKLSLSECPGDQVSFQRCQEWQHRGFCREERVAAACASFCARDAGCRNWASNGYCTNPHRQEQMRKLCHCACSGPGGKRVRYPIIISSLRMQNRH